MSGVEAAAATRTASLDATSERRKRKRKRQQDKEKLQQYGIDLPEIAGLPVTVIPLHVYALRKTGLFFRKHAKTIAIAPYDKEEQSSVAEGSLRGVISRSNQDSASETATESVVERLLQRVDRAANETTETITNEDGTITNNLQRDAALAKQESEQAIQSWLQALRRESTKKNRQNGRTILTAAIEHLWKFILEKDERMYIRRTSLHLMGHVLEKSADLRRWFLEEENRTGQWTAALVQSKMQYTPGNMTAGTTDIGYSLLQREGFMLLQHLEEAGYSELYPRLRVAIQCLQQQFPWIQEEASHAIARDNHHHHHHDTGQFTPAAAVTSLAQLRQTRDLAMQHWWQEERMVRRLLVQSDECMRLLVPRLGDESTATLITVSNHQQAAVPDNHSSGERKSGGKNCGDDDDKDDEDSDESIDWEEGIMEDHEEEGVVEDLPQPAQAESHAEAVERTLAVMQSSARMQTGQLEIHFDASTEETSVRVTPEMVAAKDKLAKCVARLSERHVDRLNVWVDALTRADNLVVCSSGSLIQMAFEMQQRRRETLQSALQLKGQVASCLSAAKRLVPQSIPAATSTTPIMESRQRRAAASHRALRLLPRNERLLTAVNRRRHQLSAPMDHSRKRSAKVRIKYR